MKCIKFYSLVFLFVFPIALIAQTESVDQVVMAKPNPEAYLKALELSGLHSYEVLAFEDSISGIQAAKAAGIQVLKIKIPKYNI